MLRNRVRRAIRPAGRAPAATGLPESIVAFCPGSEPRTLGPISLAVLAIVGLLASIVLGCRRGCTASIALDVVAAGRPVGDLHRLAAVGATRADGSNQRSAMGFDGHGKKWPRWAGPSWTVGGVSIAGRRTRAARQSAAVPATRQRGKSAATTHATISAAKARSSPSVSSGAGHISATPVDVRSETSHMLANLAGGKLDHARNGRSRW
jgi:hypothetical protein